jgi:adenylate cyclase class 2
MAHEVETKVLDIDKEETISILEKRGAKKVQDTRLKVDWYQVKGIKEGDEEWYLRIRSNSEGVYEVTWKAKSDHIGVARKHKEINFNIEEPEKLADLFEELGLDNYAHQEKDRISFLLDDWRFDIDDYPGMPPFLEIEGESEDYIKEAMKMLGIENNRTWNDGERTLIFDVYGLDWYEMRF